MNSIEKTLTAILTLAFLFFLSSSITKTNQDIHAEKEKENAMKIAAEEAKKKIKKEREEKTIHVQIVHDADPNTNTASVTLSSGNSYDPENDAISFNWTQISGETIEIEDPLLTSLAGYALAVVVVVSVPGIVLGLIFMNSPKMQASYNRWRRKRKGLEPTLRDKRQQRKKRVR